MSAIDKSTLNVVFQTLYLIFTINEGTNSTRSQTEYVDMLLDIEFKLGKQKSHNKEPTEFNTNMV